MRINGKPGEDHPRRMKTEEGQLSQTTSGCIVAARASPVRYSREAGTSWKWNTVVRGGSLQVELVLSEGHWQLMSLPGKLRTWQLCSPIFITVRRPLGPWYICQGEDCQQVVHIGRDLTRLLLQQQWQRRREVVVQGRVPEGNREVTRMIMSLIKGRRKRGWWWHDTQT